MRNLMKKFLKNSKLHGIIKNNKISSKTVNDVLRPIYILGIIFGLHVFSIPRGHSRPKLSWFYSILLLSLNYGIWRYREENAYHSKVFNFDETINYFLFIINYIVLFTITTKGLYHSESLKLCAKKMHEIDKTLVALGSSSYFDKIYRKIIIEIIFNILFLIFTISIIMLQVIWFHSKYFQTSLFYLSLFQYIYCFMVEFLLVIEFCTMVRCIKLEFQRANDLLSDVNILPISSIASKLIERSFPIDSNKLFNLSTSLPKMHSRLQVETHKINRSRKLLRTIRQVHLELYRISKTFSKMYGIQISLEIAICILCNTFVLYSLCERYLNHKSEDNDNNIFHLTYTTTVCLQYSIRIFIVNYVCDRTTEEAERTNEIIHTFYGKNTDPLIKREVEIFSMQLMQCHTTYSAFGLYNFGCKHICSCIGIIATYVVIMVQVSNSLKNES